MGKHTRFTRTLRSQPLKIEAKSQFYDLIEIFRIGGFAPNTNYLFLGQSVYVRLSSNRRRTGWC